MTNLILIPCLFLFLSQSALAEDDCTADTSEYTQAGLQKRQSIFDSKGQGVSKVLPSKLLQFGFEDSTRLVNGTLVTYWVGGCAHFGYSFTFKGPEIAQISNVEVTEKTETLLKGLALKDSEHRQQLLSAIADAKRLKKTKMKGSELELPCGDANCKIERNEKDELKISYDFAL